MDMDSAASFLASSILIGLGIIVIGITIVVLNNIFHKYWKPTKWSIWPEALRHPEPVRFMSDEEAARIAPHLETETKEKK